jgi:YHS domain-containing protein
MKIKYRIKQIGNTYYCQQKIIFWKNIRVLECNYGDYESRPDLKNHKICLTSNSLENAKYELKKYTQNYLHPFTVKGHLVQSYYNSYDSEKGGLQYYYISNKNLNLFSNNAEKIIELISEYEYKKKRSKQITIHEYSEED